MNLESNIHGPYLLSQSFDVPFSVLSRARRALVQAEMRHFPYKFVTPDLPVSTSNVPPEIEALLK